MATPRSWLPRSWLRRNRLALVALPFLLALAMAANGQRVVDYWWPSEAHVRVAPGAGGYVRLSARVKDANGPATSTFRVRYVGARTVTTVPPEFDGDLPPELDIPSGVRVWQVTLHFEAPPDDVIGDCEVTVLDSADRDYRLGLSYVSKDAVDGGYPCVPADDPGPQYAFEKGPVVPDSGLDDDDDPRPPSYDYAVYVVMPKDRRPDRVRVSLKLPKYAEF
ncbi:MAG: hypothetical protein JWO46_1706, partial [Nocardioidaceae bacterium]|nr:hypothetical protein [Nocardioidaceae bacterium]